MVYTKQYPNFPPSKNIKKEFAETRDQICMSFNKRYGNKAYKNARQMAFGLD